MNDISFPSPDNQWSGNVSTAPPTSYMQTASYPTEYIGLNSTPFKLEAGIQLANSQYPAMTGMPQYTTPQQYGAGQYHNFLPPGKPSAMLMEIANIKQEPVAGNCISAVPSSIAALSFQEMFDKEKKASKFKCDICDKYFAKKPTLKLHMRTHTGERPYHCNVCGKSFTQKQSVKIHMRIHTGEKPFKCETCEYTARTKGNLDNHMRKHTGERPFICKICQKSYTQKSSLNTHVKTVHSDNMIGSTKKDNKERPYQCTICSKRYTQKSSLNTHMKACHNSTISESLRPRAVTGASQSEFNSFSREGGAKEPQTSTNQSAVSSQAAPITAGNQITCQTTSLGASSMNMLTPQSSCSSGYPSPIIRKENMLSFHVTPLLQSL